MGIIYLLRDGNDKYKIGITTRKSTKRIKELKTGNPEKIELVSEFKSKWYSKIESTLHRQYYLNRLEGEWFDLKEKDTQSFISECQNIHNRFQMLEDSGNPFIS